MKTLYLCSICSITVIMLLTGCIRTVVPTPPPPPSSTSSAQSPVISGVNPTSGPQATQVTITGTGFNDTLTLDTVYFNGIKALITSASNTQLVVTVPAKAGTGLVTVDVKGTTVDGPAFTYQYSYTVSTLAGGNTNQVDGTGTNAGFGVLNGITNDGNGNLYVPDLTLEQVRKVTTNGGVVTTFAGTSVLMDSDINGTLTTAAFAIPSDVIVSGNIIYVLDGGSGLTGASIRMISGNTVTSIVGGGTKGNTNGTGAAAHFGNCFGFAMDNTGNFYVPDPNNYVIRKVSPSGVTSTFAGDGGSGSQDGTGTNATFNDPYAIAIDKNGNLFVSDSYNNKIREITPAGVVTTFAGSGSAGSADGTGTAASFNQPQGLTFDNNGNLLVADMNNNKIRMITPAGVVTTIAGNGTIGLVDGPATSAQFAYPCGLTVDPAGIIYVADGNNVIRKITWQ